MKTKKEEAEGPAPRLRKPVVKISREDWFPTTGESYDDARDRLIRERLGNEDDEEEPPWMELAGEIDWRKIMERLAPGDRRNDARAMVAESRYQSVYIQRGDIVPEAPRGRGRPPRYEVARTRDLSNAWRWTSANENRITAEAIRAIREQARGRFASRPASVPRPTSAIAAMRHRAELCKRERALDYSGPSIASARRGRIPYALLLAAYPPRVIRDSSSGLLHRVQDPRVRAAFGG